MTTTWTTRATVLVAERLASAATAAAIATRAGSWTPADQIPHYAAIFAKLSARAVRQAKR